MAQLEYRIAVVTGAGQGIGRAIDLGLAREGAKTVIADLNAGNRENSSVLIESLCAFTGGVNYFSY